MSVWPDYLSKAKLAKRLDVAEGAIDQMVARGRLPPPISVGDALRWRWADVDAILKSGHATPSDDPYLAGAARAASAPAARRHGQEQDRQAVLLPAKAQGHR